MTAPTEWYRDQYLISTSPSLIQPAAVNAAFGSKNVYWARPINETLLKKMLNNSLCFGLYELPSTTSSIAGKGSPSQIGLARLITDEVSFAYLTDVYVLDEFQGRGLGTWLIECVQAHLSQWPELRRLMLVTSQDPKFYEAKLGVKAFPQGLNGTSVYTVKGPGSTVPD